MKKINWVFIAMLALILTMTMLGVYGMEEIWIESETAYIWIVGMICATVAYGIMELKQIIEKVVEIIRMEK